MSRFRSIQAMLTNLEKLEGRVISDRCVVAFLNIPDTLDREAVIARHMELFPEDSSEGGPSIIVTTNSWTSNPDDQFLDGDRWVERANSAWRSVAREEMARHSRTDLKRIWDARALAVNKASTDPYISSNGASLRQVAAVTAFLRADT